MANWSELQHVAQPAGWNSLTNASAVSATRAVESARGTLPVLPEAYCVVQWYAAYTCANHEKRVAEQLDVRDIQHFLPVYESVRRWRDRRVKLELPLFPGYVFVRMALRDRLQVVQVPGVVRLVGFDATAAALPEEEIEALRSSLAKGVRAVPHPFLKEGHRVRVKNGPMAGLEGILRRRKSRARLVVSLDLIQRAVALEIDEASVGPVPLSVDHVT